MQATIAAGMAPGLWRARRKGHGFFRFRDCDRDLATRLVAELEARVIVPPGSFQASDLDPKAVEATGLCADAAGVSAAITIEQKHFEQAVPAAGSGLVVTNPPYGERLGEQGALEPLYADLGRMVKERCSGWSLWLLSGNPELTGALKMKASRRIPISNGGIDCRWLHYEIR